MKTFLKFIKPYWGLVILTIVFVALQSFSDLILPDMNATIIDQGVLQGDIGKIIKYGIYMILLSVLVGAASLASSYFSAKMSMLYGRDIRSSLFHKIEQFSQQDMDEFGTATLITRNTNDVNQMQMMLQMLLRTILTTPIMLIGGIIMAAKQDPKLTIIMVCIIPIVTALMVYIGKKGHPMFKLQQTQVDRMNEVLREQLSGVRVIRAFVRTPYEARRYADANEEMRRVATKAQLTMTVMQPATTIVMNFATLFAYWMGASRINSGVMQIGALTAFVTYLSQILMSVSSTSMLFNMIPRAITSIERVQKILDHQPSVSDDAVEVEDFDGGKFESLEFRHVSFAYPGAARHVLDDISFVTHPGETTAIIGSTGSGKSTLVNLIPRVYDVTEGQILINGRDIRTVPQEKLRSYLGYIPQTAFLFDGTISSNMRYGKSDATPEEMWHALEIAQGKAFVEDKAGQLESEISQSGSNVSGGQRQRLSIARAVIRKPSVYIFDDSFSALDFKTDANLRAALKAETKDAAVLIVAQRVTTVMNANRIVVLDEGKIVGLGTHKELLETCPVYKEIVLSQISEEEVA